MHKCICDSNQFPWIDVFVHERFCIISSNIMTHSGFVLKKTSQSLILDISNTIPPKMKSQWLHQFWDVYRSKEKDGYKYFLQFFHNIYCGTRSTRCPPVSITQYYIGMTLRCLLVLIGSQGNIVQACCFTDTHSHTHRHTHTLSHTHIHT